MPAHPQPPRNTNEKPTSKPRPHQSVTSQELRLKPAELDEVRRQVTEIINQADDVIHLYPLCDSCLARSEVHGTAPALDNAGLYRGVW